MKTLALLFLAAATSIFAGDPKSSPARPTEAQGSPARLIFRDPAGRVTATAQTANGQTTFRNAAGQVAARARAQGNHIAIRDSAGRVVQTIEKKK